MGNTRSLVNSAVLAFLEGAPRLIPQGLDEVGKHSSTLRFDKDVDRQPGTSFADPSFASSSGLSRTRAFSSSHRFAAPE
jgi:hypothetical protein